MEALQSHKQPSLRDAVNRYEVRREMAKTFVGFCLAYLPHYLQQAPADFHGDLLSKLEDPLERFLAIEGFRGSAKSTFASLALVLYLALEKPKDYPFILPMADTATQAALNIAAIKFELEYNPTLLQDYGSFEFQKPEDQSPEGTLESDEEWQAKNMLLSNGVRILARSRGQKVRGLRHREHRPKVVIVDDPEDLEWVRKKENRDKTETWLTGEVIPAVDEQMGRLVVIGNRLHSDALMPRLQKNSVFRYLSFPLIRPDGTVTWPAKYPTKEAIEKQKRLVGPRAFLREYLLKVVPEEGAPIRPEWIRYYKRMPDGAQTSGLHGTGIDLAISKEQTADYTAMVSGVSVVREGLPKIYVRANPINDRLSFHETIETAKGVATANPFGVLFVEDVQYQRAAVEEMQRAMLPVVPMKATQDKRARLMAVAPYIQNGVVEFAETGCEDLIIQLLGFGVEEHDDLVDALVYLILGLVQQGLAPMEVKDLFGE